MVDAMRGSSFEMLIVLFNRPSPSHVREVPDSSPTQPTRPSDKITIFSFVVQSRSSMMSPFARLGAHPLLPLMRCGFGPESQKIGRRAQEYTGWDAYVGPGGL